MNDVIRAMEERRSIRSFKPVMPPKEDIEQIIEMLKPDIRIRRYKD